VTSGYSFVLFSLISALAKAEHKLFWVSGWWPGKSFKACT